MNALKLICLLIVFPLLLAALGGWERQRADETTTALVDYHITVTTAKQQLQALAAKEPTATVDLVDEKISVQMALSRLAKIEAELPIAHRVNGAMRVLTPWVMGLGLLAALIGTAALAGTYWAGRRARQSRERLVQAFSLGSRLLPYVLVGHVVAVAAAVALALSFEGLGMWHIGRLGSGEVKLMAVLGVIAAFCVYSIWQLLRQLRPMLGMFKPEPLEMFGQVVTPAQAPGLWRHVDELAGWLGALPPDHIVVSLAQGFYVTSSAATVQPANTLLQGRTLLGSDLIQGWLMRPSLLFGVFFMQRFDHAVNHWSRERELLADAAGAQLVGPEAAASALLRMSVLQPHVEDALLALCEAGTATDLPDAVFTSLRECKLQPSAEALEIHQPHPTDSHPSNGERLQALHVPLDDTLRGAIREVDSDVANAQMDAYFSAPQALREQLSRDVMDMAVSENSAHTQLLETLAASAEGERSLHEGGQWRGVLMAVSGLPFVLAALFILSRVWLAPERLKGTPLSAVGAGACLGLIGLGLLWLGIRRFKRAPQTALRLTPEHFVFNNLAQPLPIEHIEEITLQFVQGIWVTVQLTPEAPLPVTRKTAFGVPGVRVNKKKRQVLLLMAQLCIDNKKIEPYEGLSLMLDYRNAALARKILQSHED